MAPKLAGSKSPRASSPGRSPRGDPSGGDGGGGGEKKAKQEEERVHVYIRVRPCLRSYEGGTDNNGIQVDLDKGIVWSLHEGEGKNKSNKDGPKQFVFDKVLKEATQQDMYEAAGSPVIEGCMEGFNGCIMCYGQTGAGKTFTLACEAPDHKGIMLRAFDRIFGQEGSHMQMGYTQVYMEALSDLFDPSADVQIREDPKKGVFLTGLTWKDINNVEEAIVGLQEGNKNRTTAHTLMNADSSRSHACLMLKLSTKSGTKNLSSMLYLVDLAGSERIKKSGVEGKGFEEACAINQSLTVLGRCIEKLAQKKSNDKPPFRESKLTRLLQSAFGGNSKTTLIVCVAPSADDSAETLNSLEFGQQAMNVSVRAKVNASVDFSALTTQLQQQLDDKQTPLHLIEMRKWSEVQETSKKVDNLHAKSTELVRVTKESNTQITVCNSVVEQLKLQEKQDKKKSQLAKVKAEHEIKDMGNKLQQEKLKLAGDKEIKQKVEGIELEKQQLLEEATGIQAKYDEVFMETEHTQNELEKIQTAMPKLTEELAALALKWNGADQGDRAKTLAATAATLLSMAAGSDSEEFSKWKAGLIDGGMEF